MDDAAAALARQVHVHYEDTPLPAALGPSRLSYIAALAARYARAVLPVDPVHGRDAVALEALALWLSLLWAVDGIFDACRAVTRAADVQALARVLGTTLPATTPTIHSPRITPPHPLLAALLVTAQAVMPRYRRLMRDYVPHRPLLVTFLDARLGAYLRTVRDDQVPALGMYAPWRNDSGAMDCVMAHVLLFSRTGYRLNAAVLRKLSLVGLAVSLYNDLVSLPRDVHQHTPNLVTMLRQHDPACADDMWAAMHAAVAQVDAHVAEARTARYGPLAEVALQILNGSLAWHQHEPRYADGILLLDAARADDIGAFYALLAPRSPVVTPGDPVSVKED